MQYGYPIITSSNLESNYYLLHIAYSIDLCFLRSCYNCVFKMTYAQKDDTDKKLIVPPSSFEDNVTIHKTGGRKYSVSLVTIRFYYMGHIVAILY